MNKRIITTKLVRKTETDEWVVKVYVDGKYDENSTYYTNDKADAIMTQKWMDDRANNFPLPFCPAELR